jgi:hypothetical protein
MDDKFLSNMTESVTIRKAENGYVISFCEKTKSMNSGNYENTVYKDCTEVFKADESTKMNKRVIEILGGGKEEKKGDD